MSYWARAIAGIAGAILLVAVFVSHVQQMAQIPTPRAAQAVAYLTSSRTVAGIPVEFFIALWFSALFVTSRTRDLLSLDVVRFWSGVVICAVGAGLAYQVGLRCMPMTIATLGGITVVLDSFMRLRQAPAAEPVTLPAAVLHDWNVVRRPQRLVGVITAIAVAGLAAQYLAFTSASTTPSDREAQIARWYESEPRVQSHELVAPGKIRVVAFSDYVCPACSIIVPELERTVQRYQNGGYHNIEWELKDFPLHADCNPAVSTRIRQLACRTAVAARVAARLLSAPDEAIFRDHLYRRHGKMTEADLKQELEAANLLAQFNQTYDDELKAVRQDAVLGAALGIRATPTVFVDGRLLRDPQPRVLAAILAHLVSAVGTDSATMAGK